MIERLKSRRFRVILGIVLMLIVGLCVIYSLSKPVDHAIKKYNMAVDEYNLLVQEYNTLTKNSYVENIENMPLDYATIKKERAGMIGSIKIYFTANTVEKIMIDTDTIHKLSEKIKMNKQIVDNITVPDEEWVIEKLDNILYIKDIEAVTEKNDPNGLFGKEGGYESCIYFTLDALDAENISGNSIVEKGTDAGGSIEVYKSLEDAKRRCEYLKSFDGTLLYSGSYAIVGTMVVRTSYLLEEEDQLFLTDEITKALTSEKVEIEGIDIDPLSVHKIEIFIFSSGMDVIKKTVEEINEINRVCDELNKMKCEEDDQTKNIFPIGPAPILFRIYSEYKPVQDIKIMTLENDIHQVTINKEKFIYQGSIKELRNLCEKVKGKVEKLKRSDVEFKSAF